MTRISSIFHKLADETRPRLDSPESYLGDANCLREGQFVGSPGALSFEFSGTKCFLDGWFLDGPYHGTATWNLVAKDRSKGTAA